MKAFGLATAVTLVCTTVSCGGVVRSGDKDSRHDGGGSNLGVDGGRESGGAASHTDGRGGHAGGGGGTGGTGTNGGQGGNGTGGTGGSGESSGGAANDADAASALPPDLRTKPTVWIGQTNRAATLPEVLDAEKKVKPQKLVLILAPIVDAQSVSGTVTFGDAAPPAAPTSIKAPYPPRSAAFPSDWLINPYAGFEYSIVWSVLAENHLTLAYVPSELFRDWCALHQPGQPVQAIGSSQFCECSETECHNVANPITRIDLVVEGDSMGGALSASSSDLSTVIEVRLKRVN